MEPKALQFDDPIVPSVKTQEPRRAENHEPKPLDFDSNEPNSSMSGSYNIPSPKVTAARWFGTGTVLSAGGMQVQDALVFAGNNLPGIWGAAVDTALPAQLEGIAGKPGARTYAQLSMRQRHAFLSWLASGRRAPLTDPCLLIAFLAGAEQYFLEYDGPRDAQQDAALMAELLTLQDTYSRTQALTATQCLNLRDYVWIRAQEANGTLGEYPELPCIPGTNASPALRWVLGQYAAWQAALPGNWAYLWAQSQLRGVHLRLLHLYAEPLRQLFIERYSERFGIGITFAANEAALEEVAYSPVHPGMQGRIVRLRQPSSFLRSSPAWLQQLSALMADCLLDLQHYIDARFSGKSAEESANLLPVLLWPEEDRLQFRELVTSALDHPTVASFEKIAPFFRSTSALSVRNMEQVQEGLTKLGLACFPPLRRLTKPAASDAPVILFACAKPDTATDDLTALALGPVGLLSRLATGESEAARKALADSLSEGAKHDGRISKTQRRYMPAVWLWLHAGGPKAINATQWSKLPDVAQAQEALALLTRWCAAPHTLPPTPVIDKIIGARWRAAPLTLNQQKVAALTQETAEVSQLLGKVFEEPEVAVPVPVPTSTPEVAKPASGYRTFMTALAQQDYWDFDAFDKLAREHGLMAGAAAEWVNDRAFDEQGVPALEEQGQGWACDTVVLQSLQGRD